MAYKLIAALGLLAVASSPAWATSTEPVPVPPVSETADTKFCMYVEPATGSRIETVECWTREQWAEQGVDVDTEWPKEGVRS